MISMERSASIVFSVHSLSDLTWMRKKLYSTEWITLPRFNNLTKLTKTLTKKISATGFGLFQYKKGSILTFLVCVKNFGQYIKFPLDKLVKKKIIFGKYFVVCETFECLLDDLVDF